jgi:hypothetical protein
MEKVQPSRSFQKHRTSALSVIVVCLILLSGMTQPATAISKLQRYIPKKLLSGFSVDPASLVDDPQVSYPYTAYFSSTVGWFTGKADFNAPRTLVHMYRLNSGDQLRMADAVSNGGVKVKLFTDDAVVYIRGKFGSLWWRTPTSFIELYATSPKMTQTYLLDLAKGIGSNNQPDAPMFSMPKPAGTKTTFVGRLSHSRASWSYSIKSTDQVIAVGSEAVTALELETEILDSTQVRSTVVRGKPALVMANSILWMESSQQVLTVASSSTLVGLATDVANSLVATDSKGWQAFAGTGQTTTSSTSETERASDPIAVGEDGSKSWAIARIQHNGKPCFQFTIGQKKQTACPSPNGLTFLVFDEQNTQFLVGLTDQRAEKISFWLPKSGAEWWRLPTDTLPGESTRFFIGSTPGKTNYTVSAYAIDKNGKQIVGPVVAARV